MSDLQSAKQLPDKIEPTADGTETASSRRTFLAQAGLAGLAAGGLATSALAQGTRGMMGASTGLDLFPGATDGRGHYVLPPLPYGYDALEPHIDEETMRLHHDHHHQGYVNGLNSTGEKLTAARPAADYASIKALSRDASFHGGGHFLHCIFWASMSPDGGGEPSGDLAAQIRQDFGSFQACRAQFLHAANAVEGSGWGILAWSVAGGKLVVLQSENHNLLSQWADIPLLVVDVWEHAYYKKYSNNRGQYTEAFTNVINWANVAERYGKIRTALG